MKLTGKKGKQATVKVAWAATLKNPFWLFCSGLFLLHQCTQKLLGWPFLWADNYLDDLLCMPILLTVALAERRFFTKNPNYIFSFFDTIIMVLALAILFEEGYPRCWESFTRDNWDYAYYFLGGLAFYFFGNYNPVATTSNPRSFTNPFRTSRFR